MKWIHAAPFEPDINVLINLFPILSKLFSTPTITISCDASFYDDNMEDCWLLGGIKDIPKLSLVHQQVRMAALCWILWDLFIYQNSSPKERNTPEEIVI